VITSSRVAVPITLPAAYYLDCTYQRRMKSLAQADGRRVVVLVHGRTPPPPFARDWPAHRLRKTTGNVESYIQPRRL
jgi:hypothetical protein